ncbi:hypothetical protein JYU34_018847 [Plutella xylostella]|uniref:Mannosyltransferase n=1 Tax=Plutella xylostella TaxID=51655 RepID=A0ABQ7PYM8_PLUXY|nr:hypothetical protein JYU34_018847 [Plutella xylostella]
MGQLLYFIASLHVVLCPFTKVEESFNIQAIHDILYHRLNLSQYDHNEFPGVVPRTFVGPLLISGAASPAAAIFHLTGVNKFWMQYVVRLTLALFIVAAWKRLRDTLQKQYGHSFAWWYTAITITQYHFMFYMSRPLPNIMAMPLVLLAFEGWLSGKYKQFIISAGASIIIFRSELAMLFGLFVLIDLQAGKLNIQTLLKVAIPAGAGLVALTVCVDSIFWGRLLWPEAEVFWYNTVLNKSSDWGTSPFLWYFYSALPRGLGPSLALIPVGLYLDKRFVQVAAPAITYILLYSFLPHKELRFIIYVFPLLNMASAAACSYIYIRRSKAPIFELMFWGAVVLIVGNLVLSTALVSVAVKNYPGGAAILKFHKNVRDEPYAHVHICNLAAQTGVTRFTELHEPAWRYSKNESLTTDQLMPYTHLLVEAKSKYSSQLKDFSRTHVILDSAETFSHITINTKLLPPVKIKTRPAIFLLERKDFREYPRGHVIEGDEAMLDHAEVNQASAEEVVTEAPQVEPEPELVKESEEVIEGVEETYDEPEQTVQEEYQEVAEEIIQDEVEVAEQESEEEKLVNENEIEDDITVEQNIDISSEKIKKGKKYLSELKASRQEKKKKAITKIKSETRKEVVASAKEKLRELMRRRKQMAEKEAENVFEEPTLDKVEIDGRGDIPEDQVTEPPIDVNAADEIIEQINIEEAQTPEDIAQTNQNIDSIVEEVIARLLDRRIYDDKTKPEDISLEDRHVIQQIVEEVIVERMNKSEVS